MAFTFVEGWSLGLGDTGLVGLPLVRKCSTGNMLIGIE